MKKINKKILTLSLGISGLVIVTPIVLASCATTNVDTSSNLAKQIIDFNHFKENVYVNKTDNDKDPFAPIKANQELYQFAYELETNKLDDAKSQEIITALDLKKELIANDLNEYHVKRDFRNVALLKSVFSGLIYDLQSQNSGGGLTLDGSNGIDFDSVLNQNLESIVRTKKVMTSSKEANSESISFTWYVYPKNDSSWDINLPETKNAYFSINIYNKKTT